MSFGGTLYRLRTHRGISQGEVARRSGLNHTTISRLEADNRHPIRATVLDVAIAVNATPRERDELLMTAGFAPVDINNYLARTAPELAELAGLLDRLDGVERMRLVRKLRELAETVREQVEAA